MECGKLFATSLIFALSAAGESITLRQAVDRSVEKYPSIRVSLEQVSAAAAGVQLARTAFLPKADFLSQVNRATRNNVFGMLMPQSMLPSISGPPLHENKMTSVWGTAVGFLVSWEPFDFGLRKANVDAADVVRRRAEAGVERTKLDVATAAADAFLTILAAEQLVASAKASVTRGKSLETAVGALVKAELRPGADGERTRAEIADHAVVGMEGPMALLPGPRALRSAVIQGSMESFVRFGPSSIFVTSRRPGDIRSET